MGLRNSGFGGGGGILSDSYVKSKNILRKDFLFGRIFWSWAFWGTKIFSPADWGTEVDHE